MNSFESYGFETPLFNGEILKEVDGWFIGWMMTDEGIQAEKWNSDGESTHTYYNLTPIKPEWYDVPTNYPAMLIRDTEERLGYRWVDNKEDFIKSHRQGFRIMTKAERGKLFV